MPSQSWGPSVSTNSAPQLTISYDSFATDINGNGSLVNPRATFTYKSGWTDTTNNFSVGGSAVGSANFGAQSLSGGATKTFNLTPVNVALSYTSTTRATIVFTIANVSFFTGDAKTISYTMNIDFPVRPTVVGSITSAPNFTIGGTQSITFTNPSSTKVRVRWAFGSQSGTVIASTTGTTASWNTSSIKATLLGQIPTTTSGVGTIFADYYQTSTSSTIVGTATATFTATAASADLSVTVGSTSLQEESSSTLRSLTGVTYASSSNSFISGVSKIGMRSSGHQPGAGATIASISFSLAGSVYNVSNPTTSDGTAVTGVITSSVNIVGTKTVTDSRGRSSKHTFNVTMIPYSRPTATKFTATRGVGSAASTVTISWNTNVSNVNIGGEKNSLQAIVDTSISGGSWTNQNNTTLAVVSSNKINNNGTKTFTVATNTTASVRLRLIDKITGEAQPQTIFVATEVVPFSIGSVGIGAGKVWQSGALDVSGQSNFLGNIKVTGDIDATRLINNVNVVGTVTSSGAMYTDDGFYLNNYVLGTTHLDTVIKEGNYLQTQTANAIVANGYPSDSSVAGFLEVLGGQSTSWSLQRYTTFGTSSASGASPMMTVHVRRYYNSYWSPWREITSDNRWKTLTYQNGWVDFTDTTWRMASYRKEGDTVHLSGMMRHATPTTTGIAAVLPDGFITPKVLSFPVMASTGMARVDLTTDGFIRVQAYYAGGTANWVNLSGISFTTF